MNNIIETRLKNGEFSLIAEIGVNYYDIAHKLNITSLDSAKFMILAAKNAGIHAVKFQSYKADTLASKKSPAYWDTSEESTKSQYELFKKYDSFGEKEYIDLKMLCDKVGIEFSSTPFDFESVDYLDPLMNFFKISSSDLNNLPFIEYIAKKNKPILLSTGASNEDEIHSAVKIIRKHNQCQLTLLHCVLEYPTPYQHANLNKIVELKTKFPDVFIGYSDHTKPDPHFDVIKTAYILGAQIVEKHFTLDKKLNGNDHYHAMDPKDAEEILNQIKFLTDLKGTKNLLCLESEKKSRLNARRSIVTKCAIQKGEIITREMLTFKRPGTGISPNRINQIVGKKASRDLLVDEILIDEMLI